MKKNDNIIVFDIETRNTFSDVGARAHEGLRLSIMVAYLYQDDSYRVFNEENIEEFIALLKEADLIVGFNIKGFDLPVLQIIVIVILFAVGRFFKKFVESE